MMKVARYLTSLLILSLCLFALPAVAQQQQGGLPQGQDLGPGSITQAGGMAYANANYGRTPGAYAAQPMYMGEQPAYVRAGIASGGCSTDRNMNTRLVTQGGLAVPMGGDHY